MAREPEGASSAPPRVGVLGGTFDPPHLGHVQVATDVADALALDRVLWIPAATPPHKRGRPLSPGAVRMAMVEAACASDPRFRADPLELDRAGVSYTVDTLRALKEREPEAELFLILGVDQFRTLDTGWKDPAEVVRLATLAVMDRGGMAARDHVPPVPGIESAVFVPVRRVDVSATEVRRRVAAGEEVSGLVPPGVEEIIRREGLYRPAGASG